MNFRYSYVERRPGLHLHDYLRNTGSYTRFFNPPRNNTTIMRSRVGCVLLQQSFGVGRGQGLRVSRPGIKNTAGELITAEIAGVAGQEG